MGMLWIGTLLKSSVLLSTLKKGWNILLSNSQIYSGVFLLIYHDL